MTEVVEGVSVAVIKEDPEKYLNVKILEVDFIDSFEIENAKKKVEAPHWPSGKYKFNYSEKPAVMNMGKKSKASVTIEVDSKGVSGNGTLKGNIKGYIFEGKMSLSSGKQTVTVTLKDPPDSVQWLKGSMVWEVLGGELASPAGVTYVELFFVFDDPIKLPFFSKGVWAEALRFLFEKGKIRGATKKIEAVKKVTQCCFTIKYHKYEIKHGSSRFGGFTGKFKLSDYMYPKDEDVNCYDQTYAVIVFSGALGLTVEGLFMDPFGFLNLTNLVGRGSCNNPFPKKKYQSEMARLKRSVTGKLKMSLSPLKEEDYLVVGDADPDRIPFGNHMYCEYKRKIYDACAGPAVGSGDRKDYVNKNIDSATTLNALYSSLPGQVSDISNYSRILDTRGFYDATVKIVK